MAGIAVGATARQGDGRLRLRAATDVNAKHILTGTLQRYLDAIAQAFPSEVRVEIFHSGQLFNDRDIARAIFRGDLDVAAPTIMALSRIVPECGITSLAAFYGRPSSATHRVLDGPVGREIDRRIANKLGAVIAGRYVDLGHADLFCLSPAIANESIAGLKIRVPSSAPSVLRLRALGAYPVMMPFADVPFALSQSAVDALETTAETVRTTQLWDTGLRLCIRQEAIFIQYVPLISGRFWACASQRLRGAMLGLWEEITRGGREEAAARQIEARLICERHGIRMVQPSPETVRNARARLSVISDSMVKRLEIDADLARRAAAIAAG